MTLRVVGVIERRQPLPPGRYWISVINSNASPDRLLHFEQWCEANAQTVLVEKSEPIQSKRRNVDGRFVIFSVLIKTTWDSKQFGFPNVAGPEVQTSDDTVQRPPKPTSTSMVLEFVADILETPVGQWAILGGLFYYLNYSRAARKNQS